MIFSNLKQKCDLIFSDLIADSLIIENKLKNYHVDKKNDKPNSELPESLINLVKFIRDEIKPLLNNKIKINHNYQLTLFNEKVSISYDLRPNTDMIKMMKTSKKDNYLDYNLYFNINLYNNFYSIDLDLKSLDNSFDQLYQINLPTETEIYPFTLFHDSPEEIEFIKFLIHNNDKNLEDIYDIYLLKNDIDISAKDSFKYIHKAFLYLEELFDEYNKLKIDSQKIKI